MIAIIANITDGTEAAAPFPPNVPPFIPVDDDDDEPKPTPPAAVEELDERPVEEETKPLAGPVEEDETTGLVAGPVDDDDDDDDGIAVDSFRALSNASVALYTNPSPLITNVC